MVFCIIKTGAKVLKIALSGWGICVYEKILNSTSQVELPRIFRNVGNTPKMPEGAGFETNIKAQTTETTLENVVYRQIKAISWQNHSRCMYFDPVAINGSGEVFADQRDVFHGILHLIAKSGDVVIGVVR